MIREQILADLKKVLDKLKISQVGLDLEHPTLRQAQGELDHGDYSTSIALRVKKQGFANRIDLAQAIIDAWRSEGLPDCLTKIEVAKPGFINLWLKQEYFISEMQRVLKEKDRFGKCTIGKGKTVIVDYSGPNIAKPFGIGHLRSTNIGQVIYNLYRFLGWKTISVNHLGDWGTQFGKLIYQVKSQKLKVKSLTIEKLEKLYVDFHKKAAISPRLEEEARFWFKKLEEKDPEAKKIWEACVEISTREFERVYRFLDVKFDNFQGESFYQEMKNEVIEEAKKKKVARKSQGALIIPFPNLPAPLILLKSDGATTYETRELATIKYRKQKWHPHLFIWETGVDQRLHFQQCFEAAEKLGYGRMDQFVHVYHGLIRMASGKLSTRRGQTIHLEAVLTEAIKRARDIIEKTKTERKFAEKEKGEVARAVGIGAVKYSDLKQNPQTDIIFDWKGIFSLEGDSGPYLQYTYARMQSVLAKSKVSLARGGLVKLELVKLESEELALLRLIYRFPEVVEQAAVHFAPNILCSFLFDLAQKYNLFYNKHSILQSDKDVREMRLAITAATSQVLKNGLNLLGIEVLERM